MFHCLFTNTYSWSCNARLALDCDVYLVVKAGYETSHLLLLSIKNSWYSLFHIIILSFREILGGNTILAYSYTFFSTFLFQYSVQHDLCRTQNSISFVITEVKKAQLQKGIKLTGIGNARDRTDSLQRSEVAEGDGIRRHKLHMVMAVSYTITMGNFTLVLSCSHPAI